jgi:hypothetical protein
MPPVPRELFESAASPRSVSSQLSTVDDRQDDQQWPFQQAGDHRRQAVVVAELDLVDADRVVLVDDGNHVVLEECIDRVADVQIPHAATKVIGCQQDLRGPQPMPLKGGIVSSNQMGLADAGCSLQVRQFFGPLLQPQQSDPSSNGTAGDDEYLLAGLPESHELVGDAADPVEVQGVIRTRQSVGPDLHDDRARGIEGGAADRTLHGPDLKTADGRRSLCHGCKCQKSYASCDMPAQTKTRRRKPASLIDRLGRRRD